MSKERSNITPKEDLMTAALNHYAEAAAAIHHWNSDIPKAIKQYYVGIDAIFAQRLRDELIKYNTYLYEHCYTDSDIWAEEPNPADEYIKSREK